MAINKIKSKKSEGPKAAPRPRGRPSHADASRALILDAAATLFSRHGYEGVSLKDVAERTQLKAGSLYHYFASKEAMLDAVFQEGVRLLHTSVLEAVGALPADADSRTVLTTAMEAHLRALHGRKAFIRANLVLFGHAPRAVKATNVALRRDYADYWRTLIADAVAKGDIAKDYDQTLVRLFIIGAFNGTTEWFDPKLSSIEHLAKVASRMFFEGLQPRAAAGG